MKKIVLSLLLLPIAFTLAAALPCDGAIHNGLAINFSASTTSQQIQASDFFVSLDPNCAELATVSFSEDPNDNLKTFNCSNVGTQIVEIFVTDNEGNQTKVSTYVTVQDQIGACSGTGNDFCQSNLTVFNGLAMALSNTNDGVFQVDKLIKSTTENCPGDFSVYFGDGTDTEVSFNSTTIGTQFLSLNLTNSFLMENSEFPLNRVQTYIVVQPPLSTSDCIPVPIVYNGLAVSLDNTGIAEIDAALFDAGSYNNCGGDFVLSFSMDVTDTKRTFDCFYQGTQFVDIWITDTQTGTQNKVQTYIFVQDGNDICPEPCPANLTVFNGLATSFSSNTGTVQIDARNFHKKLNINCLDFSKVSFSEDENDVVKTFDCSNIGTQPVNIYIKNGANQLPISTYIFVQDNLGACNGSNSADCQSTLMVHNGLAMALSNTNSGNVQTSHLIKEAASTCAGEYSVTFESTNNETIQFNETTLGFQPFNLNMEIGNMLTNQVGTYVLVQPPLSTTECIPVPIVYNALATTLPSSGTIEVAANIFDAGSYTDCGGDMVFSFSADVMDTKRIFDCSDVGTTIVNIWVTDTQTGTQNKVETYILIGDALGICQSECPPNLTFSATSEVMAATYSVSDYIDFQSIVDFSDNLTLKAGNQITLLPGTHIQANSDFLAIIEDCSSNGLVEATEMNSRITLPKQEVATVLNNNTLSVDPNPFSQTTNIEYTLSNPSKVSLAIYDMNGQLIEQIIQNTPKDRGQHRFSYHAQKLEVGMYFLVLRSEEESLVKKVAVFR